MLVRNLMIYGVGGIITPFVGIKIIDLIISPLLEMIGFIGFYGGSSRFVQANALRRAASARQ